MDILKYTTKVRKGQHLTAEERHDIEVHLKDGWSTYKIAKHLGRSYNTVKDEIERGTVLLYNGKVKRYKASVGEQVYKAHHHTAEAISEALQKMLAYFSEQYSSVFKTITADNGSEFADLSLVENGKTKVYFTHPYSSFEKGTVECHNRMFRRFIPKGKSIDDYSADDICFFADSINGLPRKILGYKTPEELFEQELDLIYAA